MEGINLDGLRVKTERYSHHSSADITCKRLIRFVNGWIIIAVTCSELALQPTHHSLHPTDPTDLLTVDRMTPLASYQSI